ncbi:cadherin-22-like [Littorina saxatilis]|uniref:cadherin-22-like n=1 Tax=Littorina saxatilis TaxID=31220 RepID=UPI0038B597D6
MLFKDGKVLGLHVKSPLDYETQPHTIILKITANDGFCDSETYDLTVRLVDVNEPPVLEPASQTLESCEGKVDLTPLWRAGDPDTDDVIKFTNIIPNEKGAFVVNPQTGVISTVVDYGIDTDEEGKETVVTTVTVTDRRGETATAEVTVRFVDCNDNPPVFHQEPAKRIEVQDCKTSSGTVVGSVDDAKDADSAYNQNNVFAYSGVGNGAKVEPSGAIVLTRALTGGEVITFPVLATDVGMVPGPLSSKPYYVSISVVQCNPSEPLTPAPYMPQPCRSQTEGLKFTAITLVAILGAGVLGKLMCVM